MLSNPAYDINIFLKDCKLKKQANVCVKSLPLY
jgi:hypothetical protein